MLIIYFGILFVLSIYGLYRVKQVIEFWRYSKFPPKAKGEFTEDQLPHITVQLPLFNEMYVVERLVKSITEIDYPRDRLEIQVLDDSTDETVNIGRATVDRYAAAGFDIHYIHRDDRTGFKAGALENGMKTAKGELIAIFDADFVPKPDFLRKLVHYFTDPIVGCSQMRWAHINGSYNLLTRLQTIRDETCRGYRTAREHGGSDYCDREQAPQARLIDLDDIVLEHHNRRARAQVGPKKRHDIVQPVPGVPQKTVVIQRTTAADRPRRHQHLAPGSLEHFGGGNRGFGTRNSGSGFPAVPGRHGEVG